MNACTYSFREVAHQVYELLLTDEAICLISHDLNTILPPTQLMDENKWNSSNNLKGVYNWKVETIVSVYRILDYSWPVGSN